MFSIKSFRTSSSPPRNPMYAAKTPPATVAIPPIITKRISDLVILSKYALIINGASVWPRKIFPATLKLSAPEIFKSLLKLNANIFTTFWITPR